MNSWSCAGHPGHIELPVPVYHVAFFDQMYRLLKAQCAYCHRLRMPQGRVNAYACKLRLLQYGLVDELAVLESMGTPGSGKKKEDNSPSDDEDDEDDLMAKKNAYVKRCVREALSHLNTTDLMAGAKNPVVAEYRRALIREFFKEAVAVKKCCRCTG